ncbi:hypothetical protein A2160_05660 [Candidatus Beckwithbacteria bacterium RBG_13_42_9]|uniref:Uncharacterized protein n=1 Tax=Candidatus Beckwithbacteria bacterium RBG_13_42_9 TaxID=1797457 RepID=A0A1F5E6F0_9BACT|nr:MAG: hypothetical protein A2160_05660 [Candidatus Beckwithbacteria bacterium RBG_13_42_9]
MASESGIDRAIAINVPAERQQVSILMDNENRIAGKNQRLEIDDCRGEIVLTQRAMGKVVNLNGAKATVKDGARARISWMGVRDAGGNKLITSALETRDKAVTEVDGLANGKLVVGENGCLHVTMVSDQFGSAKSPRGELMDTITVNGGAVFLDRVHGRLPNGAVRIKGANTAVFVSSPEDVAKLGLSAAERANVYVVTPDQVKKAARLATRVTYRDEGRWKAVNREVAVVPVKMGQGDTAYAFYEIYNMDDGRQVTRPIMGMRTEDSSRVLDGLADKLIAGVGEGDAEIISQQGKRLRQIEKEAGRPPVMRREAPAQSAATPAARDWQEAAKAWQEAAKAPARPATPAARPAAAPVAGARPAAARPAAEPARGMPEPPRRRAEAAPAQPGLKMRNIAELKVTDKKEAVSSGEHLRVSIISGGKIDVAGTGIAEVVTISGGTIAGYEGGRINVVSMASNRSGRRAMVDLHGEAEANLEDVHRGSFIRAFGETASFGIGKITGETTVQLEKGASGFIGEVIADQEGRTVDVQLLDESALFVGSKESLAKCRLRSEEERSRAFVITPEMRRGMERYTVEVIIGLQREIRNFGIVQAHNASGAALVAFELTGRGKDDLGRFLFGAMANNDADFEAIDERLYAKLARGQEEAKVGQVNQAGEDKMEEVVPASVPSREKPVAASGLTGEQIRQLQEAGIGAESVGELVRAALEQRKAFNTLVETVAKNTAELAQLRREMAELKAGKLSDDVQAKLREGEYLGKKMGALAGVLEVDSIDKIPEAIDRIKRNLEELRQRIDEQREEALKEGFKEGKAEAAVQIEAAMRERRLKDLPVGVGAELSLILDQERARQAEAPVVKVKPAKVAGGEAGPAETTEARPVGLTEAVATLGVGKNYLIGIKGLVKSLLSEGANPIGHNATQLLPSDVATLQRAIELMEKEHCPKEELVERLRAEREAAAAPAAVVVEENAPLAKPPAAEAAGRQSDRIDWYAAQAILGTGAKVQRAQEVMGEALSKNARKRIKTGKAKEETVVPDFDIRDIWLMRRADQLVTPTTTEAEYPRVREQAIQDNKFLGVIMERLGKITDMTRRQWGLNQVAEAMEISGKELSQLIKKHKVEIPAAPKGQKLIDAKILGELYLLWLGDKTQAKNMAAKVEERQKLEEAPHDYEAA